MLIKNNRGNTLIMTMVGVGISAILIYTFMSITTSQVRETQALAEKIASLEYSRQVTALLANAATCSELFKTGNIVSGNATVDLTTSAKPIIQLASLGEVRLGQTVSSLSNNLLIAGSEGIQVEVQSPIQAVLKIRFDQGRLVRSLKDLSFPILLQSSGPLASTQIEGCASATSTSGIQSGSTQCRNGWFTINFPKPFNAPPIFTATYRCNDWNYSSCPNVTVAIRGKDQTSATVGCFHSPNGRTSFDYGFLDWIATEP